MGFDASDSDLSHFVGPDTLTSNKWFTERNILRSFSKRITKNKNQLKVSEVPVGSGTT
jgi:hypothetical protein